MTGIEFNVKKLKHLPVLLELQLEIFTENSVEWIILNNYYEPVSRQYGKSFLDFKLILSY